MIQIEDILKNIPISNEMIALVLFALILSLIFKQLKKSRMSQDEKNKKGAKYEIYVSNHYKNKDYTLDERGGFDDGGIDLIAYKNNQVLLIQCKNWNTENSFKITEKDIREFYGACHFYVDENNIQDKEIICIYVIPDKTLLANNTIKLFKKHYLKCRYEIINYNK